VVARQLLVELDDGEYQTRVKELRSLYAKKQAEAAATVALIEQEERTIQFYVDSAARQVEAAQAKIQLLQLDLDQAGSELERARYLLTQGAINRSLLEQKEETYQLRLGQRQVLESDLAQAQRVAEEARGGRYFTGYAMQGNKQNLLTRWEGQKGEVERVGILLQEALDRLDRTKVYAPRAGIVYTINRLEGDRVGAGQLLITLDTKEDLWTVARFEREDAKLIHHNDHAEVFLPSLDLAIIGRVQAIGHAGLSAGGLSSEDLELSLQEVPVKIILERVPPELRAGLRADVKIQTGFYWPLLPKLFLNHDSPAPAPAS
jgi:multidrug resistance efflux pump